MKRSPPAMKRSPPAKKKVSPSTPRKKKDPSSSAGDGDDDEDEEEESEMSGSPTPLAEPVVRKKPAGDTSHSRLLESAQTQRGRVHDEDSGKSSDPKPVEKWFDGARAGGFALDFEFSGMSTGALMEIGIYIPSGDTTTPARFAGSIAGVLDDMVRRDDAGMEVLVRDPMGSTSELNTIIRQELTATTGRAELRHLRIHLCGGATADRCQAPRGALTDAQGKQVPMGNHRTSDGWIHSNYWRLRTIEDITEPWLIGMYDYDTLMYPDQVRRRCHKRSGAYAVEAIRPSKDPVTGAAREVARRGDVGTAVVPREGGRSPDVEFMGKTHSSSTVEPRRIPPPPVGGARRSSAMDKVKALGTALVPQRGTMFGGPAPLPPPSGVVPPHLAPQVETYTDPGGLGPSPGGDLVRRHFPPSCPIPPGDRLGDSPYGIGIHGSAAVRAGIDGERLPEDQPLSAKLMAGKFLQSLKARNKSKKEGKDVHDMLAKRMVSFNKSSSSGSNVAIPERPAAMHDEVWAEVCQQLGICPDGTDLNEDGMNVPGFKKKKKKKKKKHKGRRHSHNTSYSSSDSSSYSSSSFRLPSSRAAGRENPIAELSRKKPGKLFTQGLRTMAEYCDPSAGSGGGETLPASAYRYLTTLVSAAQGMHLKQRDQRELQTLAVCCDRLSRGDMAGVGDVLMQRFKAVESSASKSWEYAKQLELVPETQFQSVSLKEQEVAAKMAIRESQLQRSLKMGREEGRYPKGG